MANRIIIEDCEKIMTKVGLEELGGKEVLLTGATGLIGTYLLYSVYVFNQSAFKPIRVTIVCNRELPIHLKGLGREEWLNIINGDLSEDPTLFKLGIYDVIIHAAGYAQPNKFMDNQLKTLRINTYCTQYLLGRVKINGRFLFISTSELYSGSDDIPYKEQTYGITMPDHPRACYIEGKRCGEAFCNIYAADGKIQSKIARVALAYGPGVRLDDSRVLYSFIKKGLDGDIRMLDSGSALRVYCYVADTVENLWNILLKGKDITYNVGGISHTSIYGLAKRIAQILNVGVTMPEVGNGEMTGAPKNVYMDISKVKDEFGKIDYLSLEDGLRRTVDWYRQYFI